MKKWNKHIFTAELPYEKDAVVSLFLRENFAQVDDFIMSLGQMSNIPPSRLLTYKNGKLVNEKVYVKNNLKEAGLKLYLYNIPKALTFVTIDLIRALKTVNFKCDIFFAQHFMPAFVAIILRKLGILKCNKIVFWMFDFFLIPPEFLRSLYYRGIDYVQNFIRTNVDEIWYTTPRLAETDVQHFGSLPTTVVKRLTHAVFFRRISVKSPRPIPPLKLAFLGSLRRNNAVYEAVKTVENCIKLGMKAELHIIGSGPEENRLIEYVKKSKISKAIKFYGFVDDGIKIAKIFSRCHLGLSLYPSDPYGPNWYLTSGKSRRYIAQGLPLIVTTVPYLAKYIYDYEAGIIVDNDPGVIAKELKKIYDSPKMLNSLRRGVNKLYHQYQADNILNKLFTSMFSTGKI